MTGIQSLEFKRESERGIQASIMWKTCLELTHFLKEHQPKQISVSTILKSQVSRGVMFMFRKQGGSTTDGIQGQRKKI